MKNSIKIIGTAMLFVGAFAVNHASAQVTSSGSANAYCRVVTPIHVAGEEEMNFGAVVAPNSGSGTATIRPDHTGGTGDGGTITYVGLTPINQHGYGNDPEDGDGVEEARFIVTGEPSLTYSMVLSSTGLNKMVGAGTPLALSAFTTDFGGVPPQTVGTLPASGSQEVNVGATVTVPAGQPSGWYKGQINMTATYQ
ncbi:MAG: DUF4402 domain-containing protein [Candidatus Kapaibacterium sp.]|jgi:hypothetical protein